MARKVELTDAEEKELRYMAQNVQLISCVRTRAGIILAVHDGKPSKEIKEGHQTTDSNITRYCKQFNVDRLDSLHDKRRKVVDNVSLETKQIAYALYMLGMTNNQIADLFGYNPESIESWYQGFVKEQAQGQNHMPAYLRGRKDAICQKVLKTKLFRTPEKALPMKGYIGVIWINSHEKSNVQDHDRKWLRYSCAYTNHIFENNVPPKPVFFSWRNQATKKPEILDKYNSLIYVLMALGIQEKTIQKLLKNAGEQVREDCQIGSETVWTPRFTNLVPRSSFFLRNASERGILLQNISELMAQKAGFIYVDRFKCHAKESQWLIVYNDEDRERICNGLKNKM